MREQDPGAVAGVGLGAGGAAMLEVDEDGQGVADDGVGGAARDVHHEPEPARIVLGGRLVQGPRLWHHNALPSPPPGGMGRNRTNRSPGGRNRGGDRWVAVGGPDPDPAGEVGRTPNVGRAELVQDAQCRAPYPGSSTRSDVAA